VGLACLAPGEECSRAARARLDSGAAGQHPAAAT